MNTTDALIQYLIEITTHAHLHGVSDIDYQAHATTILSVTRPAEYASIGDVAKRIGRNKTTVLSWIARGQHDTPPALGRTGNGEIWDMADWDAWAEAHPRLVIQLPPPRPIRIRDIPQA